MTLGQAVKSARKNKGWTQERLGTEAGLGQATISALENDELGARADMYTRTLIKVSEALDASHILVHHCETCPIRTHLFQTHFDISQDKRQDLITISRQLREQWEASFSILDELARILSTADLKHPNERENVKLLFEKMTELEQGIRILKFQVMLINLL
jgi:transcriptional regulator with XRE-family HTH domain